MENKLSYYTVFSDPVNSRGDSILFCTRTGHGIIISPSIRQHLEQGDISQVPEVFLQKLQKAKAVVPKDEDELQMILSENKDYIAAEDELYEVIQPSAMCQLGCDYCGQQHEKHYIKNELHDKIVARIRQKVERMNAKSIYIGWFGGEPLMGLPQIRALSYSLKELAAEKGIPYNAKIVTNGLSLKENIFVELAKELNINQIEITLDGTAEYHDQRRITKEGKATFDIIFGNLMKIVNRSDFHEMGCRISMWMREISKACPLS
jgi:uncharacterized protein